jgi:hypothetical protein
LEVVAVHREIPVKVTAWIDEGVAPLVLALNELEDVMTLDSCQGDDEQGAHVFFCYRGGGRKAALFAADLAAALAPHEQAADYALEAEWRPGAEEPVFRLVCPAANIDNLARVLSEAFAPLRGRCGRALRN